MITCCPKCGVAEYDDQTETCGYCHASASGTADDGGLETAAHPIHALNVEDAKALVAEAETVEALTALQAAETAHPRYPNGRAGVLQAIEKALEVKADQA